VISATSILANASEILSLAGPRWASCRIYIYFQAVAVHQPQAVPGLAERRTQQCSLDWRFMSGRGRRLRFDSHVKVRMLDSFN
jgi:hypothetical protein